MQSLLSSASPSSSSPRNDTPSKPVHLLHSKAGVGLIGVERLARLTPVVGLDDDITVSGDDPDPLSVHGRMLRV